MTLELSDIAVRVNPSEAAHLGITQEELTSRLLRKGFGNVIWTEECALGIVAVRRDGKAMSSLVRALFTGDAILTAQGHSI